jgi:HSP20 family molecular chaperone IbpA
MELNSATQQIPKDHWSEFANDVSRLYQGWDATIEVLGPEFGAQPEAQALPFQGLSFESKGGSAAGDILIEVGDVEPAYEAHRVDHPSALRMVASIPGVEADIEIESEDGTTTVVRLRNRPALPPPGSA